MAPLEPGACLVVEFLVLFFVEILYVKKDLFMDYDDFLMDNGHVDLTVLLFVCFGIFGMDFTMVIEVMWFKVTNFGAPWIPMVSYTPFYLSDLTSTHVVTRVQNMLCYKG